MKRILSFILAIAMIATMCTFAIGVSAEDTPSVNKIYFKNTRGWGDVYLHVWGGDATNSSWPGYALEHVVDDIWCYADTDGKLGSGGCNYIFDTKKKNGGGAEQTGNLSGLKLNSLYILDNPSGWNQNPSVYPVGGEDIKYAGVIYDEPISTTFGTAKNLLPEDGYTFRTDDKGGLTFLLKFEGIPAGESVTYAKNRISIYHTLVSEKTETNEDGEEVKVAIPGNINNFNSYMWNGYAGTPKTLTEDGVYAWYVPFSDLSGDTAFWNAHYFSSAAGVTKVEEFKPFQNGYGNGDYTVSDDITVSLVGIVEGNITPRIVAAYSADNKMLGMKMTTVSVDAKATKTVWSDSKITKVDTGFSLFGDMIGSDGTQFVSSYADANGNKIEYVLGQSSIYPQYSEALPITIAGDNTVENTNGYAVDVTVNAENVSSMNLALTYDKAVFTNPRLANGTALEETTNGALLTADAGSAKVLFDIAGYVVTGDYSISASGTANVGSNVPAKSVDILIHIDSLHQEGSFFSYPESVRINSAEEGTAPKAQTLWNGNVSFGGAKDGATFVFKVEGVETPIIADKFNYNADVGGWDQWTLNCGQSQNKTATYLTIEKDGYYYMYVNKDNMDNRQLYGIKTFNIFGTTGNKLRDAVNTNENARFTMLAIVADNLSPVVSYYSNGELIGSYTKKYTDYTGRKDNMSGDAGKGELVSVSDIFRESTGLENPIKASDSSYSYNFIGWYDEKGNDVSDKPVYEVMSVHAEYEPVEITEKYTATFMCDDTVYCTIEDVLPNSTVEAPVAPEKEDDATGKFIFMGWSLDGENIVNIETVVVNSDVKFYAIFEHQNVEFTVKYISAVEEDGTEKIFYTEKVVKSQNAVYNGIPTYATDAYDAGDCYYHKFVKWVDVNGLDVDLTNIQGDMKVYALVDNIPVTTWYQVKWMDIDGSLIAINYVAAGDGTSVTQKGLLDGKADEDNWYHFTSWDISTSEINEDTVVTAQYALTSVNTSSIATEYTASGKITEKVVLFGEEKGSYETTSTWISLLIKIEGSSEDNPVSLAGPRTFINGGNNNIDSNNSGNYNKTLPLIDSIYTDGYYYVNISVSLLTWCGIDKINSLIFNDPHSTRGGKSDDESGNATFTVMYMDGLFAPEIRFYDADGSWLYTNKIEESRNSYSSKYVPSVASMYNGKDLSENFAYWADADGNEVTQFIDSMDVHAVYNTPECTVGDVNCDGEINGDDVSDLSRYVAKWPGAILESAVAADINGDGEINGDDVSDLSRYVAKWPGATLG